MVPIMFYNGAGQINPLAFICGA